MKTKQKTVKKVKKPVTKKRSKNKTPSEPCGCGVDASRNFRYEDTYPSYLSIPYLITCIL